MLGPWAAYQKFYDPPGDRLLKWHLAGAVDVDDRSFTTALKDAYTNLTWSQWWDAKKTNLGVITDGNFANIANLFTSKSSQWRSDDFFHLVRSLGSLNFAWLLCPLVLGMRKPDPAVRRLGTAMLLWLGATVLLWILLMYLPGSTLLHQGSYTVMVLACVLPVAGLIRFPIFVAPVITWHGLYFGTTWLAYFGSAPINYGVAILIFVGLALAAITIARARRMDLALDNASSPHEACSVTTMPTRANS